LRHTRCPMNLWHAFAHQSIANRLPRIVTVERRSPGRVVDDEVEFGPVLRRFWDVVRIAERRLIARGIARIARGSQTFVDTDVEEARVLRELSPILADEIVGRIGDVLLVQAPAP